MTTREMNDLLTRVGPGTRMGNLLRRYWQPIAAAGELDQQSIKPLRILGEDLVLYRDLGGNYGLLDRHCPHRNADLSYGFVEKRGLRCNYHGWLFDSDGASLERPFEDTANPQGGVRGAVQHTAYKVQAKAGLLWAYMGPEPAPLLPDWEPYGWQNGFVQVVISDLPCNWLQCQENSIDPVHHEWMHINWGMRLANKTGPYGPRHEEIAFDEFEYGLIYRRRRADSTKDDPLWTEGRVALWPNCFYLGRHFEYRVPVDDENTLSILWAYRRVPREQEPYVQDRIPYWYGPIKDQKTGRWITSHQMNQDFVAWVGQGAISDRTREHVGRSDTGVIMMRRQLLKDIEAVERGEDPKGLIRDPASNHSVQLPMIGRDEVFNGESKADMMALANGNSPAARTLRTRFFLQYGQPPEVAEAFDEAMGMNYGPDGVTERPPRKRAA